MRKLPLAATAILLQPTERRGFQILLTRGVSGDHRFPADALRAEDFSEVALRRAAGLSLLQAQVAVGTEISPRQAIGLRIAAARALFQQAGILLAVTDIGRVAEADNGTPFPALKPPPATASTRDFAVMLDSSGWYCNLAALYHFSRWRDAMDGSALYDNHFFLAFARANDGLPGLPCPESANLWLTPEAALGRFRENAIPMSFSTFATLRTLAEYDSLESVLKDYRRAGA